MSREITRDGDNSGSSSFSSTNSEDASLVGHGPVDTSPEKYGLGDWARKKIVPIFDEELLENAAGTTSWGRLKGSFIETFPPPDWNPAYPEDHTKTNRIFSCPDPNSDPDSDPNSIPEVNVAYFIGSILGLPIQVEGGDEKRSLTFKEIGKNFIGMNYEGEMSWKSPLLFILNVLKLVVGPILGIIKIILEFTPRFVEETAYDNYAGLWQGLSETDSKAKKALQIIAMMLYVPVYYAARVIKLVMQAMTSPDKSFHWAWRTGTDLAGKKGKVLGVALAGGSVVLTGLEVALMGPAGAKFLALHTPAAVGGVINAIAKVPVIKQAGTAIAVASVDLNKAMFGFLINSSPSFLSSGITSAEKVVGSFFTFIAATTGVSIKGTFDNNRKRVTSTTGWATRKVGEKVTGAAGWTKEKVSSAWTSVKSLTDCGLFSCGCDCPDLGSLIPRDTYDNSGIVVPVWGS